MDVHATLEDEDEEEEYRTFAAKSQAGGTKRVTTSDTSGARAAVTDSTFSDTNDGSSDTDGHRDGSNESDMYWRIYGKYYERSKLTVTANFASTKQTWNVARINDPRGDSLMTYQYQVLWVNPSVKKRRYYQRTWEPCAQLLADDFRQEIELVDRWKSSEVKTFAAFWPTNEYGKNTIGAGMQGLCVFNALRRAEELCGRRAIVTQRDIDNFVADQLASRGMDMTKGTSWKVVLVFLRRLRLNKGEPIESADDWIDFYAFVRPFIVCKQK
ncbi:hypothetical protein PHMEG_00020203 [Phytophthora megakarya]|uniref:Uncharacterized protein n=1 Tax=Phytophthora megakarya TaxID=4795 RepID=A0A225VSB4_9STRA|nr:hypothetical protein PHMEG_00020203 [Phytophthora megakarya]